MIINTEEELQATTNDVKLLPTTKISTPTCLNSFDLLLSVCDNAVYEAAREEYDTPRIGSEKISNSIFITPAKRSRWTKRKLDNGDDDNGDDGNDAEPKAQPIDGENVVFDYCYDKDFGGDSQFDADENDYIIKSEALKTYSKIKHSDFQKFNYVTSHTTNIVCRRFYSKREIEAFVLEKAEEAKKKLAAIALVNNPIAKEVARKSKQERKKLVLVEKKTCTKCGLVRQPYIVAPLWLKCSVPKCARWIHVPCGDFKLLADGMSLCGGCLEEETTVLFDAAVFGQYE